MKTSAFLLLLFAGATPLLVAEESVTSSSAKFSQPGKPQIVRIGVAMGSLKVRAGSSEDTVSVESQIDGERKEAKRADGLRVIGGATAFSLTEADNVIELNTGGHNSIPRNANIVVTVPRGAKLEVNNQISTDIEVSDLAGDIDIHGVNGDIRLSRVSGGVLVETVNGDIKANFAGAPTKPVSFTSMNGPIELHVPSATKANLRFRTQNGSILTDFPEDTLSTKSEPAPRGASTAGINGPMTAPVPPALPEEPARASSKVTAEADKIKSDGDKVTRDAEKLAVDESRRVSQRQLAKTIRVPRAPRVPVIPSLVGGQVVTGQLNGGGVDIQITTMNGDIVMRKTEGTK